MTLSQRINDVESDPRLLSRFVLQAYPATEFRRPWGAFVWGVDGWGAGNPQVIVYGNAAPARVTTGKPATRIVTAVKGS